MFTWVINAVALLFCAWVIPGIHLDGFWAAMLAVIIIGLVNVFIGWILVLITLPLTVITYGLFFCVVWTLLFWMSGNMYSGFQVDGFWSAAGGALVYAITSGILKSLVGIK